MKWYENGGRENDVVVSTRIRFARNISGYPFKSRLRESGRKEIIEKVRSALPDFESVNIGEASAIRRRSFYEEHLISREFASDEGARELLCDEENGVYIMTPEEDHIRIQCIMAGFEVDEAYKRASAVEEKLDRALEFAYSDKVGYLTHCPTNAGSGLRVSVMLFLPAISEAGMMTQLAASLEKRGLTIRGMYGEGSRAEGFLYQISNQMTVRMSEGEICRTLKETVNRISDKEREIRSSLCGDALIAQEDRLMRSLGIAQNARLVSSGEMMSLYADVRLASAMHLTEISPREADLMLISAMPAMLCLGDDKLASSAVMRDRARADKMRGILAQK